MKICRIFIVLVLAMALVSSQTVSYAALSSENINILGSIPASVWYTKLIDLSGYQGKTVKGTLHFELIPDRTASQKYMVTDSFGMTRNVIVKKGLGDYRYNVPFSSEDFVDPEFNRLARKASLVMQYGDVKRAEEIDQFFDYAFLHEWGTIQSSDHGQTARVRKVLPSQFECENGMCPSTTYEEFIKQMDEYDSWVHWKNDPETRVTGWKCSQESDGDKDPTKGFGSYEEGCQILAEYPKFLDGTFRYSKVFTLHANPAVTYALTNITRPIAISKTYDSNGNITSIEKPLFPSLEQHKFTDKILDSESNDNGDIKVYRYILKEKPATGIPLNITNQEIIVDVVVNHYTCTVYMYKDRETANKKRYDFSLSDDDKYYLGGNPFPNEFTSAIRLENKFVPTQYPLTGDNADIKLYVCLLAISIVTMLYFVKKKKESHN